MVEVGGSNPPGPTKIKNPPLGGFVGFSGLSHSRSLEAILLSTQRRVSRLTQAHRQPPNKTPEYRIQYRDRALPKGARRPSSTQREPGD